ncbi:MULTISPECIES: hypothetical protein [Microcystis]|jgi:hypothetical protein|uniref:Uncharacterized protein n=2 Tax=Microcystis TaxID=1125 RepID=A0ABR8HZM1_9CHRO|nr:MULTISPECIES: hypothetical protein [Microcystis]KXS92614.1 hypothetical protein OA58_03325 [Microcystis aeruginosa NIES-88]MBD2623994.1 hypothetical protein [Microcystis flos-aquae FACHB-1344]MCA2811966.1 hypothetical protein [Microcystis sp. M090S1]BCU12764.1 hypothetical protein MAN88_33280 [Microcystis aeruginosa]
MKPLAINPDSVNIISPLISPKKIELNPIRITYKSPIQYRKAVYKIACFFRREFRYDFVQYGYEGEENDPKHVAFLWLHPEARPFTGDFRIPCIGATCFRYREWTDNPAGYAMQWIWFHPYWRRKGLLSESWSDFKQEFGDFICEQPISEAMTKFLDKQQKT